MGSFYAASEELPQSGFGDDELLSDAHASDRLILECFVNGVSSNRQKGREFTSGEKVGQVLKPRTTVFLCCQT